MKGLLSLSFFLIIPSLVFAKDSIVVKVSTDFSKAVAVGFKVNGKEYGGLGKKYTHKGPSHQDYQFGLRKDSVFGDNLDCGRLRLENDAHVLLLVTNNQCQAMMG